MYQINNKMFDLGSVVFISSLSPYFLHSLAQDGNKDVIIFLKIWCIIISLIHALKCNLYLSYIKNGI
jgi:hypothetical protein